MSPKENQKMACLNASVIYHKLANMSGVEEIDSLRRRFEIYFKDMYLSEIQKDFTTQ